MSFQAADREKLEEAIKNREKKYGYKRGSNASLTKPKDYANISESQFADPVGYNYPFDKEHIRGAITYWQHMDHRKAYSDPKARAFITERIVRAALKFGIEITYDPKDPDYQKLPESLKKQMKGYSQKSMLEDWQSFRAWQEALFKARGKRIPTV
jgi:sarcosine oxidase delta subunit